MYSKGMPVVPADVIALEMTGTGGLIVTVKILVPMPPALTALSATAEVP